MRLNSTEVLPLRWNLKQIGPHRGPVLLWIHGFLGSMADWESEILPQLPEYQHILVDLPGHGSTHLDSAQAIQSLLAALKQQLENLGVQQFVLIGYSMGGRVALHFLHQFPETVSAYVGLSAGPGLRTEADRSLRRRADEALMDHLESVGFEAFLDEWYHMPLFKTLVANPELRSRLTGRRQSNEIAQLRLALQSLGNGALPSLWPVLQTIKIPALLISGSEDPKYGAIRAEMAAELERCEQLTIENTSHAFHLEKPIETTLAIRHFLSKLKEGDRSV